MTGTVALNGGDAAILQGQLRTLERAFPALHLVVFDQQADVAKRYFPDVEFRPAPFLSAPRRDARARKVRWGIRMTRLALGALAIRTGAARLARILCPHEQDFHDLSTYAAADLIVTSGGTTLVEHNRVLPRLLDYAMALSLGPPLILFTQSLGPFRRPVRRQIAAWVLRRATLILVRGNESLAHLAQLGVPSDRVVVAPDAAFMLADGNATRPATQAQKSRRLTVAISMRDWPFFRSVSPDVGQPRYERAVAELCSWLVRERDAEVVCVSTCQGVPEYWTDDSEVATRMTSTLPDDVARHVVVDRAFHRPDELRDRLRTFDLVVATRLHAAILALCAGTPVVVIEYERKATELFAELELAEWVVEIEHLDGLRLIERVRDLIERLPAVAEHVSARVAQEHRRAMAVAELVHDAGRLANRSPA